MTLDEAKNLKRGDIIYCNGKCNNNGTPQRCKVDGDAKTWPHFADRVNVGMECCLDGVYFDEYIDKYNLKDFRITEERIKP